MRNICVFCSSAEPVPAPWIALGRAVGKGIARTDRRLIFGGTASGLMAELFAGAIAGNGKITGIISRDILDAGFRIAEPMHQTIVTADITSRKVKMFEVSDGFVVLPGGMGTLDELFSVISLNTTTNKSKPIWIVNFEGFYQHLLDHIEQILEMGLVPGICRSRIFSVSDSKELLSGLSKEGL